MAEKQISNERTPLMPKTEQERSRFGQFFGVILPIGLLVGGIATLHFIEGWPLITTLYVMTQIVTTIGYGDFVVEQTASKLFMAFYVLSMLVVVCYYLNVLVTNVMNFQSAGIRRYLRVLEAACDDTVADDAAAAKKYGSVNALVASTLIFSFMLGFGIFFFRFYEHCSCSYGLQSIPKCVETKGFETCQATGGYVKTWADAIYMSAITLSTVGFGDFQPRSKLGRVAGMVWMILGVAAAANFIGALTAYFLEAESKHVDHEWLAHLSRREFDQIDSDGSGDLSKGEFLAYTLVKHMGVDEETVEEVLKEFARIDTQGTNKVTYEMLHSRQKEVGETVRSRKMVGRRAQDIP